jgi:hypothetical protein
MFVLADKAAFFFVITSPLLTILLLVHVLEHSASSGLYKIHFSCPPFKVLVVVYTAKGNAIICIDALSSK